MSHNNYQERDIDQKKQSAKFSHSFLSKIGGHGSKIKTSKKNGFQICPVADDLFPTLVEVLTEKTILRGAEGSTYFVSGLPLDLSKNTVTEIVKRDREKSAHHVEATASKIP